MNKMKRILLTLTAMVMLCGCVKDGKPIEPINAIDKYDVKFLFEVDGVRVYRFWDGGRHVYFTNSVGRVEYSYMQRTRNTRTTHKVQTVCDHQNIESHDSE
jgi:hypothetical protein